MKLPKSVQIKETTSLFSNKYNYKIVLVCSGAGFFRGRNYDYTKVKLDEFTPASLKQPSSKIKSIRELDYCYSVLDTLKRLDLSEYDIRVESPRVSIYTNNTSYIEQLANLNEGYVKAVYLPSKTLQKIDPGKVVVKTLDYDYKVYLATIKKKDHSSFLNWATDNDKIRLTKRCVSDLNKQISWGGSYFYVKDAKALTMVKMFLGQDISRVEEVVKA